MSGWYPLGTRGGLLALRGAVFTPDGLDLAGHPLPWEAVGGGARHTQAERWPGTPAAGWGFDLVLHGTWARFPTLSVGFHTGAAPHYDLPERDVALGPLPLFFEHRVTAANALAAYLRDEPHVRAGLGDPARVAALLAALRAMRHRPRLPREPLMGDAYDLHWAVVRAYRRTHPRRYDDRPVDTAPRPEPQAVVTAVRQELPARLAKRFGDDEVAAHVRPYLDRPAWPFSALA